jgi:pyrroloquinoline quinone (PQQ) biosynthesis protein C
MLSQVEEVIMPGLNFLGYSGDRKITTASEAREAIRRMQQAYLKDPASPSKFLFRELETREEAIFVFRQISLWARNFPRWCANVVDRCPYLEVRQKLIKDMYDEEIGDKLANTPHYLLLSRFIQALGASASDVDATRPLPTVFLVLSTFDDVTRTRPWLVGLQALVAVEYLTQPLSAEITLKIWQERFGLTRDDLAFFWVHGPADEEHAGGGMEKLIDGYLDFHPDLLDETVEAAGYAIDAYRIRNQSIAEAILASRQGKPLPV